MLLSQNTRNTGNMPSKCCRHSTTLARFERFTDLNQFNMHSMSFKTGTPMLSNILFVGALFLLAVIVEGDESSRQRCNCANIGSGCWSLTNLKHNDRVASALTEPTQ